MDGHSQRRPVWQPGKLARLASSTEAALRHVTFARLLLAVLLLPLLFFVYREVTRDALIIDAFTVPKRLEETGLTSEVVANRIGDALHQIEMAVRTKIRKDNLTSLHDEGSMPDVEIPGTKLGLKTVVEITRAIFGIYPKHVSGDIVIPVPANTESRMAKPQAIVTVYITQGRKRGAAVSLVVAADDIELLAQSTAELILEQVNPYLLAARRYDHREFIKAVEIVERIIQDASQDRSQITAAFTLWGNVLDEQKKYDEAIAKYQKAINLDPKYAPAYNDWGNVLYEQKKYDEATARYQRAIKLDPKNAAAHNNLGSVLNNQEKYDEAITMYQKAIELDPKYALAYYNWGNALDEQRKYDEATARYQKAIELDSKFAAAYNNLGVVLNNQEKYDEAITMYQKAIELDPKLAPAYNNWGIVLRQQEKYDEAEEKFAKSRQLSSAQ